MWSALQMFTETMAERAYSIGRPPLVVSPTTVERVSMLGARRARPGRDQHVLKLRAGSCFASGTAPAGGPGPTRGGDGGLDATARWRASLTTWSGVSARTPTSARARAPASVPCLLIPGTLRKPPGTLLDGASPVPALVGSSPPHPFVLPPPPHG